MFNKWDISDATERLVETHPGLVGVSAHTGAGAGELVEALAVGIRAKAELFVPYVRSDMTASIHSEGEVIEEHSGDQGAGASA